MRKLEWIIPEAKRRGVRTIFMVGGIGTPWGLACARYGAEHGLRTVLGLVDQPVDALVRAAREPAGAERPLVPAGRRVERGGHLGYVETALEIAGQVAAGDLPEPATLVVPVGSGGTVAGLTLGLRIAGLDTRVIGVVVNDSIRMDAPALAQLASATGRLIRRRGGVGVPRLGPEDFDARFEWLGATYGDPTPESVRMVAAAAEVGLELEPVYTGKALAAVADLGRGLRGPVLWINTHGPR